MVAVIAHRGASVARPENTIEAFLEAGRLGADMVELDVRRTADGALAVHHDAALPDGRLLVSLQAADLPPLVPLLHTALDACAGMAVNIEIKNLGIDPDFDPSEAVAAAVASMVVERGDQRRVIVSSFNLATVDAVRRAEPSIPTALLTLAAFDQAVALERVIERGHAALHPEHRGVTAALVAAAHAAGVAVNTWTVDDPERMRALAAAGVDGIVTNVPDVALTALRPHR